MRKCDALSAVLAILTDAYQGTYSFTTAVQLVRYSAVEKPDMYEQFTLKAIFNVTERIYTVQKMKLGEIMSSYVRRTKKIDSQCSTERSKCDTGHNAANILLFRAGEKVIQDNYIFDRTLSHSWFEVQRYFGKMGTIIDLRNTYILDENMLIKQPVIINKKIGFLINSETKDTINFTHRMNTENHELGRKIIYQVMNDLQIICKALELELGIECSRITETYGQIWAKQAFTFMEAVKKLGRIENLVYTCIEDVTSLAARYVCHIYGIPATECMHGLLFPPSHLILPKRELCSWIYPKSLLCWTNDDVELVQRYTLRGLRSPSEYTHVIGSPLQNALAKDKELRYSNAKKELAEYKHIVLFLNGYKSNDTCIEKIYKYLIWHCKNHPRVELTIKTHPLHRENDVNVAKFFKIELNSIIENVYIDDSNLPLPFWLQDKNLILSNTLFLGYDTSCLIELDALGLKCMALSTRFRDERDWIIDKTTKDCEINIYTKNGNAKNSIYFLAGSNDKT